MWSIKAFYDVLYFLCISFIRIHGFCFILLHNQWKTVNLFEKSDIFPKLNGSNFHIVIVILTRSWTLMVWCNYQVQFRIISIGSWNCSSPKWNIHWCRRNSLEWTYVVDFRFKIWITDNEMNRHTLNGCWTTQSPWSH